MRNAVKCLHCNTIVESKHRHDFVFCSCKHVAVDGGKEYKKRVWDGRDPNWMELDEKGNETKFVLNRER